jgi:hypothetical protein
LQIARLAQQPPHARPGAQAQREQVAARQQGGWRGDFRRHGVAGAEQELVVGQVGVAGDAVEPV